MNFAITLLASYMYMSEAYGGHYSGVNLKRTPPQNVYRKIGHSAKFEWTFNFDKQRLEKQEFQPSLVFGEWEENKGYIHLKLMSVQTDSLVRVRSDEYDNKIKWEGNISTRLDDCYGKVTLLNLTKHDFKSYGINIFAGKSLPPRHDVFKLILGESAKIVTWKQKENSTILECEATGRPKPRVQIQKQDRILANGTGEVTFQVMESGNYYCTAQSLGIDSEPIVSDTGIPFNVFAQQQQEQETSSTPRMSLENRAIPTLSKSTKTTVCSIISVISFVVLALLTFTF